MTLREEQAAICDGPGRSQTAGDGLSATSDSDYREVMRGVDHDVEGQLPDLYARAEAARRQSRLLAGQLRESQRRAMDNWQLIQAAWARTHDIRTLRLAARSDQDRLRYSAYARMHAKLASLPVIEQAKGIIMAQCGWSENQAFDALRRASQRENIKVRDLAARMVASAVSSAAERQASQAPATPRSRGRGSSSAVNADGVRERRRASA